MAISFRKSLLSPAPALIAKKTLKALDGSEKPY
jgi:hypothetical protein